VKFGIRHPQVNGRSRSLWLAVASFIIHYLASPKRFGHLNNMATVPPEFPTSATPRSRALNQLFGRFGGAKGISRH
jgi:hypothetical protein